MKQKAKLFLMLMTMLIGHLSVWGETITFVQTSSSEGTLTANDNISYTFTNTYTGNKEQITNGNTMTLTLSGFQAGDKVTGITLSLHNNKSSGNGTVTATFGDTQIGTMNVTGLGNSYQSVSLSITEKTLTGSGQLVILISCSTNSVYCNYFEITYDTNASSVSTPYFTPAAGEVDKGTVVTFGCATEGVTFYYTTDGTDPTTSSIQGTSYTVNSNVTLKVIAVKDGETSGVATAAYTVRKNDPNLAFSQTTVTANVGEAFTPPTLTYATGYDGAITYTSSNSAIPVDSQTGEVTINASAVGKTTTITATASETDNFASGTASYVLTVQDPNAITGNLNNSTFGTSYNGSITPISDFTSVTGTIGDVTVTYAKGTASNAYINDTQIRMYSGIKLTFEVPEGYLIRSIVFDTSISALTCDNGSIDGTQWTSGDAEVTSVTFSKSSSGGLALKFVTITLEALSSSIAKPTITPATGTYTEAQTVTITNNAEGATVYYTIDGTTPTSSSTQYTAPFVLKKNGTYTVKAIAINGDQKSLVATNTITINHAVAVPVFTETDGTTFTEPYTIHLTVSDGSTIYYSIGGSPVDENGELSSTAIAYNAESGIANLSKAATITAVAVDNGGNVSTTVTASFKYTGSVTVPYYENFDEGLGNFTTSPSNSGTSVVAWEFQVNHDTETYGEERKYAFISGGSYYQKANFVGEDRLVSPVFDLTNLETASMNFIHAGHWFSTLETGADTGNEAVDLAAKKASCHLQVRIEGGDWVDISDRISNWFVQRREGTHNMYDRVNSGDIDLSDYKGKKIQIGFYFTSTSAQSGTWNVLKFSVTGTEPEVDSYETVNMKTDGYVTYVVQNDIDWVKTLANNTTENGNNINIHGYKVVEFSETTAVFVEFGLDNTSSTIDKWYHEAMIPAETPIILKGTAGDNLLVIAKSDDVIRKPEGNLLKPSYGDVTAAENQHLLVFQKEKNWTASDPYNNYAFFKLATGRTIPNRKAYLNGADVMDEVTLQSSNPTNGIYLLQDLGKSDNLGTDGIAELDIKAPAFDLNAPAYDLSGRRVEGPLRKGIYIVGGRKVIIK